MIGDLGRVLKKRVSGLDLKKTWVPISVGAVGDIINFFKKIKKEI